MNEVEQLSEVTNLPVKELAALVGVTKQAYYKWLKGGIITPSHQVRLREMLATYGAKGSLLAFNAGDTVRNVNQKSLHYGKVGAFVRYWSEQYTFACGRGCDVLYDGAEIAQSVGDLVPHTGAP